jgi:deazaflavin-dependent oxidoreductase (nitroreductase family)
MPIPRAVTRLNKAVSNKLLIHLAGHGPFVELEHVGRKSGRTYRIPLNAFRSGDTVTLALTYGPEVDWYRNVVAAGGCRIRMGRSWLTLGPPRSIPTPEGLRRVPALARPILGAASVTDFVELTVVGEEPAG